MEVAAADKDAPSTQTEVISTVKRKPPQAAKAAVSTAEAKPPDASAQAKPSQALKAVAKPSGPAPKDDVTGSVKQTAKTQEPNDEKPAVSPAQLAKSGLGPARVEDALEERRSRLPRGCITLRPFRLQRFAFTASVQD